MALAVFSVMAPTVRPGSDARQENVPLTVTLLLVGDADQPEPAAEPTVLGKAVAILRSFGPADTVLPLAELVRRTGLPKGTVHRVAAGLVTHRLLDRTPHGYRLSGGLFELGMRAATERTLLEMAMPFLQDLYERTHEIVHLGVLDGTEVVYIAKIGGHRQAASPSRAGGRMPLHCTAIGKVLLAHADAALRAEVLAGPLERRTPYTVTAPGLLARQLDAALEAGVAFEREESAAGLLCVAAPVLEPDGIRALAAISVTGPVTRFRPEPQVPAVRAAATGLASALARRGRRR
jgi:DNA-binding IclR family transcriptional regulator